MGVVLVVDDEVEILELYKIFLENEGYTVEAVEKGADGFLLAQSKKYDMIISDLKMPLLSGTELLLELREGPNADTPIAVISGFIDDSVRKAIGKLGNIYFLDKPFNRKNLVEFVGNAIKTAS